MFPRRMKSTPGASTHSNGGNRGTNDVASDQFATLMSSLPQTRAGARMPTTRKERRKARKAFKRDLDLAQKAEDDASAELRQQERATSARNKTISKQIKERDRELSGASQKQRRRRAARDGRVRCHRIRADIP